MFTVTLANKALRRLEKSSVTPESADIFQVYVENYLGRMFDFDLSTDYSVATKELSFVFTNIEGVGFTSSFPKALEYAFNLTKGLSDMELLTKERKAGTKQSYVVRLS